MIERHDIARLGGPHREVVLGHLDHSLPARAGGPSPRAAGAGSDSLLRVLWRSRWILVVCVIGAVAGGFAYIQKSVPIYTSTSKLYVQQKEAASLTVDPRMMPRYNLYTQAEVLKSSSVLGAATERWRQRRMRTFADSASPVAYLQQNMQVTVGKSDDVITVSLDSPYPVEAAEIINDVVGEYITYREKNRRTSSADLVLTLQTKLDDLSADRDRKLKALTDFTKSTMPLAQDPEQATGLLQRYLTLETMHDEARSEAREALLYKERMGNLAEDPAVLHQSLAATAGPQATTMNERAQLEARLFERRLERADLLKQMELTESHPRVARLDAEIEQVQIRLAQLDERIVTAVLAEAALRYEQAREDEEYWATQLKQEQDRVLAQSTNIAELRLLREEYETAKEACVALSQRLNDINLNDDIDTQEIRVLEVASAPQAPSHPQRSRILAMALVAGLLLGGGIAVLRDMLDQTLRSADEISSCLGLAVLGVVPAMSRREKIHMRGQRIHLEPDSSEAEAFRTIRTAVFFGAPKDRGKTMLITSPAAGDGKSTLVSNLAIAMAQAGQRTVLLDADFRKPMQNTIFELRQDEPGLSAVLAGKVKLAEAIRSAPVANLNVLPGGPNVTNPAEILNSPQFAKVLARLAEVYDRVIIDAPPVTVVTDAQILGALCDITILVVRANKSTKHTSKRAIEALRSTGTQLLGAVVNDVRRKGNRYGYYGGCGGYYGSGRNGGKSSKRGSSVGRTKVESGAAVALLTKGGQ